MWLMTQTNRRGANEKGAYVENKSKDLKQEGKSNQIHYVEVYL